METSRFQRPIITVVSIIILSFAASKSAASFIPFDWNMASSVTSQTDPTSVQRFTQVASPFQQSSFASIGVHSSQATYNFNFQPEQGLGSFNTTVNLHVGEAAQINSAFEGRVKISPTTDTPIHMDTSISYVTPSTPVVDVSVRFIVFDLANPTPPLYLGGGTGGTFTLNPAAGMITRTGDRVLLAGHTYQIGWDTSILTLSSPPLPGGPSTVSGYFNWSLTPEPAALGPLAFAGLLIRRPKIQAS